MSKRTRGTEEEEEANNIAVANLLLLLSCGVAAAKTRKISEVMSSRQAAVRTERSFECKTCRRRFASSQALGGHCTTHNRSRGRDAQRARTSSRQERRRTHKCTVCGTVFSTGQALGGHMRCHKAGDRSHGDGGGDGGEGTKKVLLLDLNMPPPEDEDQLKLQDLLFGVGLLRVKQAAGSCC